MSTPLRLLVVEDSENDTALLLRELRKGGYDVTHKRVDSAAGMQAAEDSGEWDLVMCDYSIPGFSGIEALRLHRRTGSDVPFIFLSGTIGEETAVAALKEGAQDYLMKSSLGRMLPAIDRELREARERVERRKLERQVQGLQKFEAIGRLAGGIAHDFNNSLGVILGWAELGLSETDGGTPVHDKFQIIRDQAKGAARLTSQLLAFARQQVLQKRALNLNDQVSETARLLKSVIESRIEVRPNLDRYLDSILADSAQLEQVIINLCLNARDAISGRGQIGIETRNVTVDAAHPSIHGKLDDGRYVLLSISDDGVGMDRATLDKIFEPFFTTKEMGRGTGLGLSTVYGVVRQHGGSIFVESQLGQGTTFRIYFLSIPHVPSIQQRSPARSIQFGTETILLAEDHDLLRSLAESVLESFGYRVLVARNGLEALHVFKKHAREISLVVLDLMMPHMTGTEALKKMRDAKPDLPVIFTTGYSEDVGTLRSEIEKGATLLQKPYEPEALGRAIRNILDTDQTPGHS